jgi:uncharacterized membrane protein
MINKMDNQLADQKLRRIMGYILLGAGVGHFIFPAGLDAIVPAALPGDPRIYTYLSGLAEIAIGLALLSPITMQIFGKSLRLWGAYSALALFIAVYPANINMAIEWSDRPMPEPLIAYARLPFQFYLFFLAWKLIKSLRSRSE